MEAVQQLAEHKALQRRKRRSDNWQLYLMLLPAVILTLIFIYAPMGGIVMAFQDYKPYSGILHSKWVGMDNFKFLFTYPDGKQVIWNTFIIAVLKIVFGTIATFTFALLLNEARQKFMRNTIQTIVFLPHFLSWVVLGGVFMEILAPNGGLVNQFLQDAFGIKPIFFLGDNRYFRATIVVTDIWKEFGYGSILFLAALAGINPSLYEAAEIDGAGRWKMTQHITIPSLVPTLVVVVTLSLSQVLNAGFDQIFNMYNPLVYQTGDIIDTFVYRMGLIGGNFSVSTAIGLFKSVVGLVLIIASYRLAGKFAGYKIF
ncbi:ABC transporter permease [Paenibacillus andongensis]|uniref:ABC transporter permease n=1 Tax=Paenibacillus andongensis TaxID=2975482 RepID=UPI003F59B9D0